MAACARSSAGPTTTRRKFNRVTQARRQPGSTFKTFVYTAALEAGLDTEDVRYDEPIVIDGWRPRNYDEGYRGAVTLRTAFALSINTVAAEVANEVGPSSRRRRRPPPRHRQYAEPATPSCRPRLRSARSKRRCGI
jgi:membrane peptidoglycan carboxypeptidase